MFKDLDTNDTGKRYAEKGRAGDGLKMHSN
jgi:hypothetical protein